MSKEDVVVEIKFKAVVNQSILDELSKTADHHLERLLDLDSYPEIKEVYNGSLSVLKDKITIKGD